MGLIDKIVDFFKPNTEAVAEQAKSFDTTGTPFASMGDNSGGKASGGTPFAPKGNNSGGATTAPSPRGIKLPSPPKNNPASFFFMRNTNASGSPARIDSKGASIGPAKAGMGTFTRHSGSFANSGSATTAKASPNSLGMKFGEARDILSSPPTGELSSRAYKAGKARGEDYSQASLEQKQYNRTYYQMLDDPDITRAYKNLENYRASDDGPAYDYYYNAAMNTLDRKMTKAAKDYGKDSDQYAALKVIKERDFVDLGRKHRAEEQLALADSYSAQMDAGIRDVFGGIISAPDYTGTVAAGRKAVDSNRKAKSWFSKNTAEASDTQRELLYYVYQKEGLSGVKEMYNDYLGETLNYLAASKDFASDISENDTSFERFLALNRNNMDAALDGQWWGGTKQTFTNTKADPNDRSLVGDYTIEDSLDDSLRAELGNFVNDESFQYYGSAGFAQMRADGVGDDWYKDAQENATQLQKQVLGYLYAAYNDSEVAHATWTDLKARGDEIWQTVNGANSLPTRKSSLVGQMSRDYLGMSGTKAPDWLGSPEGEDEMTVAQVVWDTAETTRAQYPQIAATIAGAYAGGPMVGRVLGGAVMSTSVYGNAYKEAVDQGYTGKAAVGYAATQAASEFAVGLLLDGVSSARGILTNEVGEKFVKNIANPFVRAMADTGISALGEGTEEYIQEITEPLIRNFWFSENNDVDLLDEEAIYSFFLGSASALLMSPGGSNIRTRTAQNKLGKALNTQKSTLKLVDTILNKPVENGDNAQTASYKQAQKLAQQIKDGSVKATDTNVGEMAEAYGRAGGDLGFLTSPETVCYTKDNLSVDDMKAGAVSMLASLDGDTSFAEDIAKMAKGESLSSDRQAEINNDPKAKRVLAQLQGDLDMDADSALTRAARMSVIDGALAKVSKAVQEYNPDKIVFTPSEQYLHEQGVGVADSQHIGAVLNKVLDGETISRDEAKLVRVSSPAIQGAVLDLLGLDISEYAKTDTVLEELNKKAAEVAKVKDMQVGVKEATKTAAKTNRRKANAAEHEQRRSPEAGAQEMGGVSSRSEAEDDQGRSTGVGTHEPGAVSPGAGAAQAGESGGIQPADGSVQVGAARRPAAKRGSRAGDVIPVNRLTEDQRNRQRRLAGNGAGSIVFLRGKDSYCRWNEDKGCYEIGIRADGFFAEGQYEDHETTHLWIKSLSEDDRKELSRDVRRMFGGEFETAFSQVAEFYKQKGYLKGLTDAQAEEQVIEEIFCFSRGRQSFAASGLKTLTFDFSAYKEQADGIAVEYDLEAMGTGDLSNERVRQNAESGNINREYFERQGYIDEDVDEETTTETQADTGDTDVISDAKDEFRALSDELHERVQQMNADPSFQTDPDFLSALQEIRQRLETLSSRLDDAEATADAVAEAPVEKPAPAPKRENSNAAKAFQKKKKGKTEDASYKQTGAAAKAFKPNEATQEFGYDAELKTLNEWREQRRAAQRRKLENNPAKSEESYYAKLKKIEDEYTVKKSQLDARRDQLNQVRRPQKDSRPNDQHSADPNHGINEEEKTNEQVYYSRAPERRSDVSGRARVQNVGRGQADTRESGAPDGRRTASGVELCLRRCEKVGILPGQCLSEESWTDKQRAVAEQLYDAGFQGVVLFRRSPENRTPWLGQSWFENGVPTVAICVNGSRTAEKVATHESWHLWLRSLKGDKSHGKHLDFVNFVLAQAFIDDPAEFTRIHNLYRKVKDPDFRTSETDKGHQLGWSANEIEMNINADIMEEIFCDLVSGQIYDDERLDDILDLVDDSGVLALAQGDYDDENSQILIKAGYLNSEYASGQKHNTVKAMMTQLNRAIRSDPMFSADPDEDVDIDELMDRSDEMRSDERDAQIWQNDSLNTDTSDASYDEQMDALMAELWEHPERQAEIYQQMEALQNSSFNETEQTLKAKAEEPAPQPAAAKKSAPKKEAAAVAFRPAAEAKPALVSPEPSKPTSTSVEAAGLRRPSMEPGKNPVKVDGLNKKRALEKVTRERGKFERWHQQEIASLDRRFDSGKINDAQYAKEWAKMIRQRDRAFGRYDDQIKRLQAMDEVQKEKATVIKDNNVAYTPKIGEWWNRVKRADNIQIRRLRSDRNTYDVRFTDSKGNTVIFDEVSPSRLENTVGEKLGSKLEAKGRLSPAFEAATNSLGEWQEVDNTKVETKAASKAEPDRVHDNYGRKIPVKLAKRMEQTTVRDREGRILSVYRRGPANGVQNANRRTPFTLWSERPATMNLLRGLNGAAAYDQDGKRSGANIAKWLQEIADHPKMSEPGKDQLRRKIAAEERKNREYTTRVTRLDPWRPGYSNPKRGDVVGNHTLLEGYVDIRSPLVIDAKGRGLDYVNSLAQKFVDDPKNLAGQVDVDGNPLGEYDGLKIINVKVTNGNQSLGGGMLDTDTIYVTFRNNQGKSTYNTDPTDSDLMHYSADPDPETGYAEGTLEDTVLKIMRDKDEAHALESLALYLSRFLQTGILPNIEDEKTKNIFVSQVTPAEEDFLKQKAAELIGKYGRIEKGEKAARDVALPRRTDDGNVRRVFRTAAEAKQTPERAVPVITREAMTRDGATYQTITNKSAIAAADRDMRSKGYDKMLAEWRAKADGDVEGFQSITKYDIAKAEMLYIEAVKVGDMETAMQTLAELAEVGTTAGQVVQAMRMLKSMPKTYQLYYMRRVVNRMNRQYAKRINSGRMSELTIRKELAQAVLRAQTQEQLDNAMDALIKDVADQIPATMADKWNAWRYLSMLGNPKTHIRNLLGNAIFMPAKFAKDIIAAGLETTFIKDPAERHTSIKGLMGGKANAKYRAFAQEDYEGIKDELQSGGKYNPANRVMDARTIFKSKTLEWLRKFNGEKLEQEDGLFLRKHYVNALTNFLATQGLSVEELTTTKEGGKILNAARLYALNEAQKATYRDASQFATALNQMKRNSGPVGILLEGIFPFTKTPINILKRGVEYSPVGLLKTIAADSVKLKNGEISANEYIDNLASGLTGTGIAALGMFLASLGILRGGDDDDDKQADFDQMQGYQNYSITIGDLNYTIDWTAPSALPLFVGCEIYNELQEGSELTGADLINALSVIAEPVTQLSMLSGLNETLKSAKWDDNPTSSIIMSMSSGYITQALPTLVAQLSRSLSADRRTTYVDKNSDVPQAIQRWWQTNILGKTPLNSQRTEYIDAWGRKDTQSNFALRLMENLFSPGYANRINTTSVDVELQKLADKTGTGVLMTVPDRTIEFNNQSYNLTADQYATYTKTRGDAAMRMLTDLFGSEGYQYEMSDSEKATAVKNIKDYANVLGKQAVFPDYDPTTDNWAEKCDGDPTRLVNMALLKAQAHELGITAGNNGNFYSMVIGDTWLTPVDQAYAIAQQYSTGSSTYIYERKGGPKYELTAERKQILAEHFRQVFPAYYIELIQTENWRSGDIETRVDLLSDARAQANADTKAWLAKILRESGAATYNP